ncbi:hypothetical protein CHS0354_000773 [Potamilus streckersoni]|uniref:VWFA domain-containing protein n=1 Tax=Potamilus streckersoni TaxID=2493646 RepID=A0AAE0T768_9BIVA|nr:hypothetical protein CHS0354_000773 [Potamilus streckersoni]
MLASENPRIVPVTILIGKRLLYNPANSNRTSSPTVNNLNARICFDFEYADERKRKLSENERKTDAQRAHNSIGCSNIQNDLSAFPWQMRWNARSNITLYSGKRTCANGGGVLPANDDNVSRLIIVDVTHSMGYQQEYGTSLLVHAKKAVLKILETTKSNDETFLSLYGTYDEELLPLSYDELNDRLLKVRLSNLNMPIEERINLAMQTLKNGKHNRKEIYVVSDMQVSNFYWSNGERISSAKDIAVMLIPIIPEGEKNNIGIKSVVVDTKIIEPDKQIKIKAHLKNYSGNTRGCKAKLYFNEKLVAEKSIELDAHEEKESLFSANVTQLGNIRASLHIDPDELKYDDSYYFSFFVPEQLKILIVYNKKENIEYFVHSINSFSDTSFFDVTSIHEKFIDGKNLDVYDFIFFADVTEFTHNTIKRVNNFLMNEGGLLIGISPELQKYDSYNNFFAALGIGKIVEVGTKRTKVEKIELKSEIISGMFSQFAGINEKLEPDFTEVFKIANYRPSVNEATLVSTTLGVPLFSLNQTEKKKVMIFTSQMTPEITNFIFQPIFAPFLFRTIFVTSGKTNERTTEFTQGSTAAFKLLGGQWDLQNIKVKKPSGEMFIPYIKDLNNEKKLTVEPKLFDELGSYLVTSDLPAAEATLSINPNIIESDMNVVTEDSAQTSIAAKFQPQQIHYLNAYTNLENINELVKQGMKTSSLWKVLLILAALTIFVEMVMCKKISDS